MSEKRSRNALRAAWILGAVMVSLACASPRVRNGLVIPGTGEATEVLRDVAALYERAHPDVAILIPDSTGSFSTKPGTLGGIETAGTRTTELGRTAVRPRLVDLEKYGPMYYREFARVPVVFVVHEGVPVRNLTSEQVCAAFEGRITNWGQVGGPDLPLVPQTRPEGSNMLALRSSVPCWKELKATDEGHLNLRNPDAVRSMRNVHGALGFVPLSDVLRFDLAAVALDGREPTSDDYPVFVSIALVHMDPLRGLAKSFADFLDTPEAAAVLRQTGHIPVSAGSVLVEMRASPLASD